MAENQRAVIDRFEGDKAVLLIEGEPMMVKRLELPIDVKEGDWLIVRFQGGKLVEAQVDADTKTAMEARISDKLERLRTRRKK